MAEQKQRYSFTDAAAQQPERQRFSFSGSAPKTLNKAMDEIFPHRGMIRDASTPKPTLDQAMDKSFPHREMIRNVPPPEQTWGQFAKEFIIPGRGYTDQQLREADPSFKEKTTGAAKAIGEIGVGLTNLAHMGGNFIADKVLPGFDSQSAKEARESVNEKIAPFITPSSVGEASTMRGVDIAGIAAGWTKAGNLDKLRKAIVNVDNTDDAKKLLRSNDLTDDIITRFGLDDAAVAVKNRKGAREFVKQVDGLVANISGKATKTTGPAFAKNTAQNTTESNPGRFSFRSTAPKGTTPTVARQTTASGAQQVPKIEQRFTSNFPEFSSSQRIDELRSRTRGTRSNEESLDAARRLGYNSDKVLRIPEGKALNAEEKMAVSGAVENERMVLQSIEDRLKTLDPDTEDFRSLREDASKQKVKLFQMMAVERGIAAEAGRALQAHKATVTAIDKNESKLAKYLSSKNTPQETKDYIYRKIEEFDGSPDEMSKLLRELDEATLLEKFVEFATAAKLWNPTTHAVNLLSSMSRMFLQSPLHALSSAFDSVLSKLTGAKRERFLSDAYAEVQGQYMGWKHAGTEAAKALKDESYAFESRILKDFEVKGPAIKGRPGKNDLRDQIAKGFGKAVRIPFRMLGVEDLLIRKPSEMGALYTAINRKARMEGLKPGTKEWDDYVAKALTDPVGEYGIEFMEEVQHIADQNLFQESLHPTLKRVSNWREDIPAIKLVIPFFRTIVNLQKQALEFSVLAPILPSSRKALREGGGARSDVLAKMTLGTAATVPLIHHAMEGNITMAAPKNPAERDAFYAEGKQPYSVRLGDSWYTYNRFSPFSEWFFTAAAMGEAFVNEDEKSQTELAYHVFFSMTQNFFDKSFATGMHDLLEALNDPDRAGYWVKNFATGATVPNFIPLAARVVDPVIRETDDLRDAYISKVPYLSKTLDPKRDVFGEPISRPGNAIQKIVSPVIPSPVEVDMVREELKDIGYQMGFPGKTAGGFEMEEETYRIYQAASGRIVYKALSQMIQNTGYQNLSPRARERAVDKIVRETREMVKTQVAQEQLIMQQIKDELKDKGYSTSQADDLAVKTYEIIKRRQEENQE